MKSIDIWSRGEVARYILNLVTQGQARDCTHLLIERGYLQAFYPLCTKEWASRVNADNVALDDGAYSAPSSYYWPKCPPDCPHYSKSADLPQSLNEEGHVQNQTTSALSDPPIARQTEEQEEVEFPHKVTIPWLLRHVPISLWLAAGGLLIAVFMAGVKASSLSFIRELFGLK